MIKKICIIVVLVILLIILTGCTESKNEIETNTEYEIRLLPMFLPTSNGTIRMVMMPQYVKKGE